MMTPHDKHLAGTRSLIVPQTKRELHDAGKVLKPGLDEEGVHMKSESGEKLWELDENGVEIMLANPRWRSILIQGVIDQVTAQILFKRHQKALRAVVQTLFRATLRAPRASAFRPTTRAPSAFSMISTSIGELWGYIPALEPPP